MGAARIGVDSLVRPARRGRRHPEPASIASTHAFDGAPGEAYWPHCRECLEPVWFHERRAAPDPTPRDARVREVPDPRREPVLAPSRGIVPAA